MKKTVMIKAYYLVDLEEDELLKDFGELDKCFNAVSKNYRVNGNKVKWNCVTSLLLDPSELNVGKCKKCGCWVSDKEKADFIEGLDIGANVDGELLCDECLPDGHPWKF